MTAYVHRPFYENELQQHKNSPDIKAITGVRRCGKSSLMSNLAEQARAEAGEANVFYRRMDQFGIPLSPTAEWLEHELSGALARRDVDRMLYVFLDEIQDVSGWEKVVTSVASAVAVTALERTRSLVRPCHVARRTLRANPRAASFVCGIPLLCKRTEHHVRKHRCRVRRIRAIRRHARSVRPARAHRRTAGRPARNHLRDDRAQRRGHACLHCGFRPSFKARSLHLFHVGKSLFHPRRREHARKRRS